MIVTIVGIEGEDMYGIKKVLIKKKGLRIPRTLCFPVMTTDGTVVSTLRKNNGRQPTAEENKCTYLQKRN